MRLVNTVARRAHASVAQSLRSLHRAGCGWPHAAAAMQTAPTNKQHQILQCARSNIHNLRMAGAACASAAQCRSCPGAQSTSLVGGFVQPLSNSPALFKDPWRITAPHHPLRPISLNECCHACHCISIWVGLRRYPEESTGLDVKLHSTGIKETRQYELGNLMPASQAVSACTSICKPVKRHAILQSRV